MIALDRQKLCFICVPKNGTHSIYKYIGQNGGRRIGKYHESRLNKIPKIFGISRYRVAMIWRDPIERAVSLYKDIVVREQTGERLVKGPNSIRRHELITKLCPTFSEFVYLLAYNNEFSDDYLLKNQHWWYKRFAPNIIIPLKKLSSYLEEQISVKPETQHSTKNLSIEVSVSKKERMILLEEWAPKDTEMLKKANVY